MKWYYNGYKLNVEEEVMKNKLLVFLLIIIFLFMFLSIAFFIGIAVYDDGSNTQSYEYKTYGTTYKFTGESDHFKFNTGLVSFSDDKQKIFISDFVQTKKIPKLTYESVTVYFDDEEWAVSDNTKKLNTLNKKIKELSFYQGAPLCHNDDIQCEIDEFNKANKDNFKDITKITITYCVKGEEYCTMEEFDLTYSTLIS